MMRVLLLASGLLLSQAALQFTLPFNPAVYASGNIIATDGLSAAYWQLSVDEKSMTVAVAAKGTGYVGFGLNYSPVMAGADMVLAQSDGTQIVLSDMHATGFETPVLDRTRDIQVVNASRSGGVTSFIYTRNLTNCDSNGDMQLQVGVFYYGLLARGTTDDLVYHGPTAREAIPLSLKAPVSVSLPGDAVVYNITAPPSPVPLGATSYVCSYHALPSSAKFHIVKFQTVSGSAAAQGVSHHVNLNACDGPIGGYSDGQPIECGAAMGCNTALLSGGYGPDGVSLPTDVGIAIGLGAVQYAVISHHFYNPGNIQGIVDSGTLFRIWYTPTLRTNEIGTLSIAQLNITIPPETSKFNVDAWLPKNCSNFWPVNGLTVTSVGVHMHESGLAAAARVIRNGVELAPLALFNPWDQSHPAINTQFQLMPGDVLKVTCTYDNPYTYPIVEGSALTNEMCVFSLTYYPRIPGFAGAVDIAAGFGTLPPSMDYFCNPTNGLCNNCYGSGICGPTGLCMGTTVGPCANCSQCSNCVQCNASAPRVYCPSTGNTGLLFDPKERYTAYTPYVNNNGCPILTDAPTPVADPKVFPVNWRVPAAPNRLTVSVGDNVQFSWTGSHNLLALAGSAEYNGCSWSGSTQLVGTTQSGGNYRWDATAVGDYYFGCSVGAHCAGGMKLWVTVQPANVRSVNWAIPAIPQLISINLGQSVTLIWNGLHDVWQLPDRHAFQQCDFNAAGTKELKAAVSDSTYTYTPTTNGTFFLACKLTGHCSGSMKLEVVVGPPLAPSPSFNSGTIALACPSIVFLFFLSFLLP